MIRNLEEKMYLMKKTKEEIDAFKAARKIWIEKERREIDEENRRVAEFLKQKEIEDKKR